MLQRPTQLSQTIKDLRTKKGWTLQRLADAVGLTKSYLSMWEEGLVRDPDEEKLASMERVLNAADGEFLAMATTGGAVLARSVLDTNSNNMDVMRKFLEEASKHEVPREYWEKWVQQIKKS